MKVLIETPVSSLYGRDRTSDIDIDVKPTQSQILQEAGVNQNNMWRDEGAVMVIAKSPHPLVLQFLSNMRQPNKVFF